MRDDETVPCHRGTLATRLASGDPKATAMTGEEEGKVWPEWKGETCCLLFQTLFECHVLVRVQKTLTKQWPNSWDAEETDRTPTMKQKFGWDRRSNLERAKVS